MNTSGGPNVVMYPSPTLSPLTFTWIFGAFKVYWLYLRWIARLAAWPGPTLQ